MGEIKGDQIFKKSAIKAPLEFAESMNIADDSMQKAINTANKLIEVMKKSESSMGSAKVTKDINKSAQELTVTEKELLKVSGQVQTARAKLFVSGEKEAKRLALLKVKNTERNKELRDEAKATIGLLGPYDKLNKRRVEAQKNLKNLIAGQKASVEEIEVAKTAFNELNEQIMEADEAAKDFTKRVGGYEEAINSAAEANNNFKGSALDVIQNFIALNQQEGGVKSFFRSFVGGINSAIKAGIRFIMTPIGAVITAIVAAIAAFNAVLSHNESASDKFNEVWEAGSAILEVVIGRVLKLVTAFGKLITLDFAGAADDASAAFDNLGESLVNAGRRGQAIARLTIDVQKLNTALKITTASLEGHARIFETIADDATRSFKQREEAANNLRELNIQLKNEVVELARTELELANLRVEQAIESGDKLREIQDEQAEAMAKLITAEKDLIAVELTNEKTRRELKQDRLERDLDILIDGFDNIKTINEKIINDDKRVLASRANTLDELADLADKSFSKQIETIKKFTKVQFDENELLAEQDAVLLNEKIRALGLSEIIEGRLLEIIRERRIVTSDLVELHKSLAVQLTNEAVFMKNQRNVLHDFNKEIISDNEATTESFINEIDKRINAQLEANRKKKEDDKKTEEEIAATRNKIIEDGINGTISIIQGFNDLRITQISDELTASEFARNRELENAEGSEAAKFEINRKYDEKRKELQRRQYEAKKQGSLFEIAINTALAVAAANTLIPPLNIPAIAFALGTGLAQAALVLAQPIPQFDEGTESTPSKYKAAEKRPEFRRDEKTGKWSLLTKPTVFSNNPGDTIVSGKETDSILGQMSDLTGKNILTNKNNILGLINNDLDHKKDDIDLAYILERNNEKLINTIRNKKETSIKVKNAQVTERSGGRIIHRLNNYYER